MAGNTSEPGASVTSRVAAVLGAFDPRHRALRLTELAGRAGIAVPTTHRLANELLTAQFLDRRPDGRFVIGRRLWELGLLAPTQTGLRELASPHLHDLYAATRATVHLAVREHAQVLYIDRLSGQASVSVVSRVGSRLPLHSTGVGKVLLAFAPEAVQASVLSNLVRITPYTITQPGRLRSELSRVRQEGYAQTSEEMSLGACSVAVPVRGADEQVIAALGIVVPNLRRERVRLVASLQVTAKGIQRVVSTLSLSENPE